MCLVVVAFQRSPGCPLLVAANRDEFHSRPTREAHRWPDAPGIVAGRDLEAGGTWLGVHRAGRFATVTNYRDAAPPPGDLESRGRLVTGFLAGRDRPMDYLASIRPDRFAGFNLFVSDGDTLGYLSNRGGGLRELGPGIHGLSNATLDTPWEKVERTRARLARLVDRDETGDAALLRLLADTGRGPPEEVRDDRLPFEIAHAITAPFIVTPEYGTRCSTIVRADGAGGWQLLERRFDAAGALSGESRFSIGGVEDAE